MSKRVKDEWDWDGDDSNSDKDDASTSSHSTNEEKDTSNVENVEWSKNIVETNKKNVANTESNRKNKVENDVMESNFDSNDIHDQFEHLDEHEREQHILGVWNDAELEENEAGIKRRESGNQSFEVTLNKDVYKFDDYTYPTPFENLLKDFTIMNKKLISIIEENILTYQVDLINKISEYNNNKDLNKLDNESSKSPKSKEQNGEDKENEQDHKIEMNEKKENIEPKTVKSQDSHKLEDKNFIEQPIFDIKYYDITFTVFLILPSNQINQNKAWNNLLNIWIQEDLNLPIENENIHTNHFQFPTKQNNISYYFSLFDVPYISVRPKSFSSHISMSKSIVRDFLSCWRCSIEDYINNVNSSTKYNPWNPKSVWIHIPFFCPSSQELEYQGIQYFNREKEQHYKTELFNQKLKNQGSKSNLYWNIMTKYSHFKPWIEFFPYLAFKKNIQLSKFIENNSIIIHAQLTHELENELLYWDQILENTRQYCLNFQNTNESDHNLDSKIKSQNKNLKKINYDKVPFLEFGTLNHPLDTIFISIHWNSIILNNSNLNNLNFNNIFTKNCISGWEIKIHPMKESECELSNTLLWFKDIIVSSIPDTTEKDEFEKSFENPNHVFSVLSTTIQTLSPLIPPEISKKEKDALKILLLNQVFGSKMNPSFSSFRTSFNQNSNGFGLNRSSTSPINNPFNVSKTFPPNSILSLFSIEVSRLENLNQIKYFWRLFMMAIQELWETKKEIPNLFEEKPDWSTSIIHQKLVLLNYCIKKSNSEKQNSPTKEINQLVVSNSENFNESIISDSDDEFVDARSDFSSDEESVEESDIQKYEKQRVGASHPLSPETLLNHINAPIMVPITQEHPPCTEDKIIEQQMMFSKMGSSKEASIIRQSMQTDTLKSDMEAFKAANPECNFEDFLKWYSPRDVEDSLSQRMSNQNMWKEIWSEAEPIPVSQQKSLFNHEKEAEFILNFFESIPLDTLLREIFLYLFINGWYSLYYSIEDLVPNVPFVRDLFYKLSRNISNVSIHSSSDRIYTQICYQFQQLEKYISIILAISNQMDCITVDTIHEEMQIHYFEMISELCKNQIYSFGNHLNQHQDNSYQSINKLENNNQNNEIIIESNLSNKQIPDKIDINKTNEDQVQLSKVCQYFIERFINNVESETDASNKEYVIQSISHNNSKKQLRISLSKDNLRVSSII